PNQCRSRLLNSRIQPGLSPVPRRYMKRIFLIAALCALPVWAYAQPRPVSQPTVAAKPAPAPVTFSAKYEGGMFGYSKKTDGTLKFDDANSRLVFLGADNKE